MVARMQVILTPTAVADKFGVGLNGFAGSVPGPPTQLSEQWFDSMQMEIVNVILGQGIALDGLQFDQLKQALDDYSFLDPHITSSLSIDAGATLFVLNGGIVDVNAGAAQVFRNGSTVAFESNVTLVCSDNTWVWGSSNANDWTINGNVTLGTDGTNTISCDSPISVLHTGAATSITSFGSASASSSRAGNFVAQHVGADGLRAATAAAALSTAAALRAVAQGDSVGLVITAADGYGATIQSDTTSPVRAAMRCVPQDADPSSPQQGDLLFNSARNKWRTYTTQLESLHSSPKGQIQAFASAVDGATINSGNLATVQITPEQTGTVLITATGAFSMPGAADSFQFLLLDLTVPVTVQTVTVPVSVAGELQTQTVRAVYTLPNTASRQFAFAINGNGATVVTRSACVLSVMGVQ
jgi:hypothetical protein